MEKTTKRKWLGVLLGFIWTAILVPGVLLALSVPTSRWLEYWLFYPFFIALLVIFDTFLIPHLISDYWRNGGDDRVIAASTICAMVSSHSGLYLVISERVLVGFVLTLGVFMVTWFSVMIAILIAILLVSLFKLFIKLHKAVFFPKK